VEALNLLSANAVAIAASRWREQTDETNDKQQTRSSAGKKQKKKKGPRRRGKEAREIGQSELSRPIPSAMSPCCMAPMALMDHGAECRL
jgi:hypothetical protein